MNMELEVTDTIRIKSIPHNFVIQEKGFVEKGENKGKEKWKDLGYYPAIGQCLTDLQNRFIHRCEVTNLDELRRKIIKIQFLIKNVPIPEKIS